MSRPVDEIIVHCTDSPDDRYWINAEEIGRWHRAKGWKGCGYHFVVCKDGAIEAGRDLEKYGAHCEGHNMHSVGIVWVGRHDCNEDQWRALVYICREMCVKYGLGPHQIFGHNDFNVHKTCPNIDMQRLRDDVQKQLEPAA